MVLAFAFGLLYVVQVGGFLGGDRTYAADESFGLGFEFGVFNIFQLAGISCLLLIAATRKANPLILYLIAAMTLFLGVMVGSRADYLPPLIIITLCFWSMYRERRRRAGASIKAVAKRLVLLLLLGSLGFIAGTAIAIWRQAPSISLVELSDDLLEKAPDLLINEVYGHRMLWIETGNMMVGGMYGLIENVSRDGPLWGETYATYLLRTPPAFLGLPRPDKEDLAYRTDVGGIMMSQGGVFEPAEAYANFGLIGCFGISYLLSYAMGFLLKHANDKGSIFFALWYLVFGLMGLRAIWYQNFGYYRIATIFALVYLLLLVFRPSMLRLSASRTAGTVRPARGAVA